MNVALDRGDGFQPSHQATDLRVAFQPFNENKPFEFHHSGFLPHLQQAGCTYFVTFRLHDSVPVGRIQQWRMERKQWLLARGIDQELPNWAQRLKSLSAVEQSMFERHFASKLFEELDRGFGEKYLARPNVRDVVAEAIEFFGGERLLVGDYVVMPNHVHALLTPINGHELTSILHSIKSWTANKINSMLDRSGEVWMKETYDRLTRDSEELIKTQRYIRANPAKANLSSGQFTLQVAEYSVQN